MSASGVLVSLVHKSEMQFTGFHISAVQVSWGRSPRCRTPRYKSPDACLLRAGIWGAGLHSEGVLFFNLQGAGVRGACLLLQLSWVQDTGLQISWVLVTEMQV